LYKNRFTFGFTAANAIPTGIGYWYSNISNTSLPYEIRAYITGPTCAGINIVFNGKYIGALIADTYNLIIRMKTMGWEALGDTKTEAATNSLTALLVYLLGISASLPYASSTIDGNNAAEPYNVNLSPEWLDFFNNSFIAINSMLYFPALFDFVKTFVLDPIFRTKTELSWINAHKLFKQEITMALISRDPVKIARAYKKLEALHFASFESFKASLIRNHGYNSSCWDVEKWAKELANDSPAIFIASLTGFLFYFGTTGLITQATAIPGLWPVWTWFAKLTRADLYPVACVHNLTNFAFAVKNGYIGAHILGALIKRAYNNLDNTALGDYPVKIPCLSNALDSVATTRIGRPVVNCARHTPIIGIIAIAISLGLLLISAGTSLAQAGDGLSGAPFNTTTAGSWVINGGAASNAFFVNSSEVAIPVYSFGMAVVAALITKLLFLLSGCKRPEPIIINHIEAEEYLLDQFLHGPLAASDEESFQASLKTPFFRQLKEGINEDPSMSKGLVFTPPKVTGSGSEPDSSPGSLESLPMA
jgi:hypothetical protein